MATPQMPGRPTITPVDDVLTKPDKVTGLTRAGHRWVYDGEVLVSATELGETVTDVPEDATIEDLVTWAEQAQWVTAADTGWRTASGQVLIKDSLSRYILMPLVPLRAISARLARKSETPDLAVPLAVTDDTLRVRLARSARVIAYVRAGRAASVPIHVQSRSGFAGR